MKDLIKSALVFAGGAAAGAAAVLMLTTPEGKELQKKLKEHLKDAQKACEDAMKKAEESGHLRLFHSRRSLFLRISLRYQPKLRLRSHRISSSAAFLSVSLINTRRLM